MSHRYFLLNEGHSNKRRFFDKLIILTDITFVSGLIFTMIAREGNEGKKVLPVFKAFHDCVRPKLTHLKGNYEQFWHLFTTLTEECDYLEAYKALDIRTAENQDETKYVAFPHRLYHNIEFFGAGPASDINKDLYVNTLGGEYFQYAVSGTNGMQKSRVYESLPKHS
ncbi:Protein CBG06405 [Caenorhabditis briggsae]|uniref:Protein CBG06405 n=1 Tax=Caenorhabditis briggsae TaxID=6238 RepID=A8X258_CAEBR|nr:Protein CBG06405 [Caenorhabditis briggsae]CAP26718.2 Protein CBG06405 [Caenorhabditis briggsae]